MIGTKNLLSFLSCVCISRRNFWHSILQSRPLSMVVILHHLIIAITMKTKLHLEHKANNIKTTTITTKRISRVNGFCWLMITMVVADSNGYVYTIPFHHRYYYFRPPTGPLDSICVTVVIAFTSILLFD